MLAGVQTDYVNNGVISRDFLFTYIMIRFLFLSLVSQ